MLIVKFLSKKAPICYVLHFLINRPLMLSVKFVTKWPPCYASNFYPKRPPMFSVKILLNKARSMLRVKFLPKRPPMLRVQLFFERG